MKIHLVDNDKRVYEQLNVYFHGMYDLTFSHNGRAALDFFKYSSTDMVILDLTLPEINGLELCKILRRDYPLLPIIILTEKNDDLDRILSLELGADDFMAKPFNPRELSARIKSVSRRFQLYQQHQAEARKNLISSDGWDIKINLESRNVTYKGNEVSLTVTEFELLKCLMDNTGVTLTREQILNKIKGFNDDVTDRLIDTYIKRLRKKFEEGTKMIKTVWGIGYLFSRG